MMEYTQHGYGDGMVFSFRYSIDCSIFFSVWDKLRTWNTLHKISKPATFLVKLLFSVCSCWWRRSCCSSCAWFWCLWGALPWQHTWFISSWESSLGYYIVRIWQIRKAKYCIYWTLVGWTIERFYCWCCAGTSPPCWQLNWWYDLNINWVPSYKKSVFFPQTCIVTHYPGSSI